MYKQWIIAILALIFFPDRAAGQSARLLSSSSVYCLPSGNVIPDLIRDLQPRSTKQEMADQVRHDNKEACHDSKEARNDRGKLGTTKVNALQRNLTAPGQSATDAEPALRLSAKDGRFLLEMPAPALGRYILAVSRQDSTGTEHSVLFSFRKGQNDNIEIYKPDFRIYQGEATPEMQRLLRRAQVSVPEAECKLARATADAITLDVTEFVEKELSANTDFFLLPERPYPSRPADWRVNYAVTSYESYLDERTGIRTVRVINRWPLRPANVAAYQSGQRVQPEEPIVFYLDSAIPACWKPYFRQAVEEWQPAFEAAGFKNAIQVRDMPANAEWPLTAAKAWITYLPKGKGSVIVHADPRSGQILRAGIRWSAETLDSLRCRSMLYADPQKSGKMQDTLLAGHIKADVSRQVGRALGLLPNDLEGASLPFAQACAKEQTAVGDAEIQAIAWGYRYRENETDDSGEQTQASSHKASGWWYPPSLKKQRGQEQEANRNLFCSDPTASARYAWNNVEAFFSSPGRYCPDTAACRRMLVQLWGSGRQAGLLQTEITLPLIRQIGGVAILPDPQNHYLPVFQAVSPQQQSAATEFIVRHILTLPEWLECSPIVADSIITPEKIVKTWQQPLIQKLFEEVLMRLYANQHRSPYTIDSFLHQMTQLFECAPRTITRPAQQQVFLDYLECARRIYVSSYYFPLWAPLQKHLEEIGKTLDRQVAGSPDKISRNAWLNIKQKTNEVLQLNK